MFSQAMAMSLKVLLALGFLFIGVAANGIPDNSSTTSSPPHRIVKRIVNGNRAQIEDAPFLVQLIKNGKFRCTGSIVASRWIISAAHCTVRNGVDKIVYGTVYKYNRFIDFGGHFQTVRVRQIYSHPEYNGGVERNDIALLELDSEIPLADYKAQAIGLEPDDLSSFGKCRQPAVAFGFGDTRGWFGDDMRMQTMTTQIENLCFYSHRHYDFLVTRVRGQTVCHGDSGGPLISGPNRKIIGILSGSTRYGCVPGDINLYVKVSHHMDFIKRVLSGQHIANARPSHSNWFSLNRLLGIDCNKLDNILNLFSVFGSPFSQQTLRRIEAMCRK